MHVQTILLSQERQEEEIVKIVGPDRVGGFHIGKYVLPAR